MIKKQIAFCLVLVMVFMSLVACGNMEEEQKTNDTTNTESDIPTTAEETEVEQVKEEYYTYETAAGTKVAPVVDIQTALNSTRKFSYTSLVDEMKKLADQGFTRVYFVTATSGYGMAGWSVYDGGKYVSGYSKILDNVADLGANANRLYIKACKEVGMEAFCVYKPYEGGGTYTVPENVVVSEKNGNAKVSTVGGYSYQVDTLIAEHPEYRIQRKADNDLHSDLPVTTIEVDFLLSAYSTSSVKSSGTNATTVENAAKNLILWTSTNNGTYTKYTGTYFLSFKEIEKDTIDQNGKNLGKQKYVTMTVSGLQIAYAYAKYFAISFQDATNLHTTNISSFRLYNKTTLLSCTTTSYVRRPANTGDTPETHDWGNEGSPVSGSYIKGIQVNGTTITGIQKGTTALNGAQNFNQWGFNFGWVYDSSLMFYANSAVYGIARGTIEYIPGGLCEAYEEVREYWLKQVLNYLAYGADGIDIRTNSHSTMAIDYLNYGYNQPVIDKYKELYGIDITKEDADYLKLAEIRGDFFIEFLEAAAELTHKKGKTFAVHLYSAYTNQTLSIGNGCVGQWGEPKIVLNWKKCVDLADEITIKTNLYTTYSDALVAKEIEEYVHAQNKVLWVHAYLQQGNTDMVKFCKAADADSKVDGILLYEVTNGEKLDTVKEIVGRTGCKKIKRER